MPIPPLRADGLLPPGLHLAEMDEIEDCFGKNTSQRRDLFIRLRLLSQKIRTLREVTNAMQPVI
jgi:hypothetical protein